MTAQGARGRSPVEEYPGNERFLIKRRVGAGGMGVVYEAFDRERGAVVALKTVKHASPGRIARLKAEFRSIADVVHPNLIRLGELIADQDELFFTMELVEGTDLISWVRHEKANAARGFDEARLRASFAQLASGIAALHGAGKLHRDVKPSNVLVADDGRVVLLDFGLAIDRQERVSGSEEGTIIGTIQYMAPEQVSVRPLGPPADWYALGVILFKALTGRLPFEGSPDQVAQAKLGGPAPLPSTLVRDVPADLDALCAGLLTTSPEERPTESQILGRLGVRGTAPELSLGTQGRGSSFVGRTAELGTLLAAFEDACHKRRVSVCVIGESGLGKTALVRRFLEDAALKRRHALVLRGRCYEQESVAYKAVDGIFDALARHLAGLERWVLESVLSPDLELLARIFPVLRTVPTLARDELDTASIPPQDLRARAFSAARRTFLGLSLRQPVVLFIDDFQWADVDSLSLLEELSRAPGAPPVLLVTTLRPGHALAERALGGDSRRLELGRLSPGERQELVRSLLGGSPDPAIDLERLGEESMGHPLLLRELVQHVVTDRSAGQVPFRLDDAILARARQLGPTARQLLDLTALAGAPVGTRLLARALGVSEDLVARHLSLLQVANLLRTARSRGLEVVDTFHDRVRQAVLADMPQERRLAYHRDLAGAALDSGLATREPDLVVRHLVASGQSELAASHAVRAAERAGEHLAFEQAAAMYRTALELAPGEPQAREPLLLGLAEALVDGGRAREAAETFLAIGGAKTEVTWLSTRQRAAEMLLISGQLDRAWAVFDEVLASAGIRMPRGPVRTIVQLLLHRAWLALRGFRLAARPPGQTTPEERILADLYRSSSYGLAFIDHLLSSLFNVKGLLAALRRGDEALFAETLGWEATFQAIQGNFGRSRMLLERALSLEPEGDARFSSLGARGVVAIFEGRFGEAQPDLDAADDRVRATRGKLAQKASVQLMRFTGLVHRGAFAELAARLDTAVEEAGRRGDHMAISRLVQAFDLSWLAREISPPAIDPASEQRDASLGPNPLGHWFELKARGNAALYRGAGTGELESLQRAFAPIERSLIMRSQLVRAETLWMRGKLALALGDRDGAGRFVRKLGSQSVSYAIVWRELLRAGLATLEADPTSAMASLRAGAGVAEKAGMMLCATVAWRRHGELGGGEVGSDMIGRSDAWLQTEQIRSPQRMCQVIAPGRFELTKAPK